MIDELFQQFGRGHLLPNNCKDALSNALKKTTIAKRNFLVTDGAICDRIYFVVTGLVRGCLFLHEKEHTTRFYSEGQTIFMAPHDWSNEALEALEETVMYSLDYKTMLRIGLTYPEFLVLVHDYLQREVAYETHQYIAFRTLNPAGRWLWFLHNHSAIINRLTPRQIASYLGFALRTYYEARKSARESTRRIAH